MPTRSVFVEVPAPSNLVTPLDESLVLQKQLLIALRRYVTIEDFIEIRLKELDAVYRSNRELILCRLLAV